MDLQIDLFTSAAQLPQFADKRLHPDERPRLNKQCIKILKLMISVNCPVTNTRLAEIGIRYSARIHEINKAGISIQIVERNHDSGVNAYNFATPADREKARSLTNTQ